MNVIARFAAPQVSRAARERPGPDYRHGRRRLVYLLVAAGVTGALIGSPAVAAAAAAPAAGAQAARSPGLATTIRPGLFEGVSCAGAAACTAVGETPAEASLVERWNGLAWAGQTTPTGGPLVAVSCPSKTACTALGMTAGALAWNGTRWARQSVPIPQANGSRLAAVSCTAATACTAVGWYDTPDELAQLLWVGRWNGTAWASQAAPSPPTTAKRVVHVRDGLHRGRGPLQSDRQPAHPVRAVERHRLGHPAHLTAGFTPLARLP